MKDLNFKSTRVACYIGYVVQATVANLPPLLFVIFRNEFGISLSRLGIIIFVCFGIQALVDLISVKTIDHIGYRKAAVFSQLMAFLGLIMLGFVPTVFNNHFAGVIISVCFASIGGGVIEVIISPIIDSIPAKNKVREMNFLHSAYSWGQVLVVLLSTIYIKFISSWQLLPVLWSLIPLVNLFLFFKVPLLPTLSKEERVKTASLFKSKQFVLFLILMVCAGASELGMSQWASYFAEAGLGVSKAMGDLLGPCLFAVFMGFGRLYFGFMSEKISMKSGMIFCSALCVVCYLTAAFSKIPIISLLGCAVCGLSVSLMWPATISLASRSFPLGGAAMFGLFAVFGDIGCTSGPYYLNLVATSAQKIIPSLSDEGALKYGFAAMTVFPIVMLSCLIISKKKKAD